MLDANYFLIFLGWCSVINISILCFTTFMIFSLKAPISKIHSKMFGVKQENLLPLYFNYLGNYKICIIVFNLVPYIALRVMS